MQKTNNQRQYFLITFFIGLLSVEVIAKRSLLFESYTQAKKLYETAHYRDAQAQFAHLKATEQVSSLTPYIHFYYGLSAYYQGEKKLASHSFFEILEKFPLWNKQDEVRYWCAICSFEEANCIEALALMASIKSKEMAQAVTALKKHFLKKIDNLDLLQTCLEKFPNDTLVRKILYKKAACHAYMTEDRSLINQLESRYNCSINLYDPLRKLRSKKKESYAVAVLLPFFVEEFDYEACKDQFVIELYQGIKLALELLKQEGIAIRLFTFDTKKDPAVTAELLSQEAMKAMDLIIGPLYPATIPLVAAFCKEYKINFVNPISTNGEIITGNPFAFLFQPSLETYAEQASALTLRDIEDKAIEEPVVAVFYGSAKEDVLQAHRYKEILEKNLGKALDLFVQLTNRTEIEAFFSRVNQEKKEENKAIDEEEASEQENEQEKNPIAWEKITHIYLPSQHELLVASVVSLPLKLGIRPLIIGDEQWIKKELLTLHHLEKLPILFLAPGYIDFNKPALAKFREAFFKQTAKLPTQQSYIGYEMMFFFGNMLRTYGSYFQKEWEPMHYDGIIFQGVCYGKCHANQYIPVLKFVESKFTVKNDLGGIGLNKY
ncbi:MAG: hypothetical protein K2X94_04995 [Amoebophilaceae bacterium]|nr:hypothetical protein [Amoebophilaceae bacterium]